MAIETAEFGFQPEYLGITPDDPVVRRFQAISDKFAQMYLPVYDLPSEQQDYILDQFNKKQPIDESQFPPDFRYGVDYFFGQYKGNPRTIEQNAAAAIYQGRQGVPTWSLLKSVAFSVPDSDRLVIVHLRGDRRVDDKMLSEKYHQGLVAATPEQLQEFGLEHGTVNPLIAASPRIHHLFDRDLLEGPDYPGSDIVLTSSGDPRFYVGFNIRRFLRAFYQTGPGMMTQRLSKAEEGTERIVARRPIFVIGGDSARDALNYGETIVDNTTSNLVKHGQYFGDQSIPQLRVFSESQIAGSIDTKAYGSMLRAYIREKIIPMLEAQSPRHETGKPLVTYGSFAMEGIAGDILEGTKGIEYVGSKEVVENILSILKTEGIEPQYSLLLGLDSAYDPKTSAFAGKILDESPNINPNVRRNIQTLIQDYKAGSVEKAKSKVFQLFEATLRGTTNTEGIQFDSLKGQVIVGIVGVSEMESLMNRWDRLPDDDEKNKEKYNNMFAVVRSNDPAVIKAEVDKARAENNQRIILVFLSPKQAVAETIAQKTLGLAA